MITLLFCIMHTFFCCASQNDITMSPIISPLTIRVESQSPPSESSSEDILCNAALQTFERHKSFNSPDIKKYILKILQEDKTSPLIDHQVISVGIIRIQEGNFPVNGTNCLEYINDVIVKATARLIEEQQFNLEYKQRQLQQRFNKKQVIGICSIIASMVSTIVGLCVNYTKTC